MRSGGRNNGTARDNALISSASPEPNHGPHLVLKDCEFENCGTVFSTVGGTITGENVTIKGSDTAFHTRGTKVDIKGLQIEAVRKLSEPK
jgi:hypothetical protein